MFLIVSLVAFFASILTFFSGFGLGTLLTPVLFIFFPPKIAVAITAIVHLLNNIFKLFLVGKYFDKSVLIQFGIPAVLASFLGAQSLYLLPDQQILFEYHLLGSVFKVESTKLILALLLILFALMEILPFLNRIPKHKNYLIAGGLFSGFFGGLSGNQGALRSAFLIKAGLDKNTFIATGIILSTMIDLSRLTVYYRSIEWQSLQTQTALIISACLAAFAGAVIGKWLLKKVTISFIQILVATLLILISLLLAAGIL